MLQRKSETHSAKRYLFCVCMLCDILDKTQAFWTKYGGNWVGTFLATIMNRLTNVLYYSQHQAHSAASAVQCIGWSIGSCCRRRSVHCETNGERRSALIDTSFVGSSRDGYVLRTKRVPGATADLRRVATQLAMEGRDPRHHRRTDLHWQCCHNALRAANELVGDNGLWSRETVPAHSAHCGSTCQLAEKVARAAARRWSISCRQESGTRRLKAQLWSPRVVRIVPRGLQDGNCLPIETTTSEINHVHVCVPTPLSYPLRYRTPSAIVPRPLLYPVRDRIRYRTPV